MTESTTEDSIAEADAAVERAFAAVLPGLQDGTISWIDLAQALVPNVAPVIAPSKVPLPKQVGDKLRLQISKLPAVFGKVAPDTVRKLEPKEVVALLDERDVLDDVVKDVADRKEDIRTIVLNHFDADMRERFCCAENNDGLTCLLPKGHDGGTPPEDGDLSKLQLDHSFELAPKSPDGHFAPRAEGEKWSEKGDGTSATGEQFSWERRQNTKSTISPALLKQLSEDPDSGFTRKDYLAMTRDERVFDENKAMLAIRRNPKLLVFISKATRPGSISAAFNVRKAG